MNAPSLESTFAALLHTIDGRIADLVSRGGLPSRSEVQLRIARASVAHAAVLCNAIEVSEDLFTGRSASNQNSTDSATPQCRTDQSQHQPTPKMYLTRAEAARELRVSTITLDRLVKRGLIAPSRATRRPIFHRDELERYMRETSQQIPGGLDRR